MDVLALAPVGRSPAQPSGRKQSLLIPTLSLSLLAVGGDSTQHLARGDSTQHLALHWAATGTRWDHKCWVDTRSLRGLGQQDRTGARRGGHPMWTQRPLPLTATPTPTPRVSNALPGIGAKGVQQL